MTLDELAGSVGQDVKGWDNPGLNYPAFHLILVAKAIDRLSIKALNDICDLTIAEWRVLSRLAPTDGRTVREISETAWVDRAEVSRAAASLEAQGITSRRDNPLDRRAPVLFITEQGREFYQRLLPLRAEFYRDLTAGLAQAEYAMLDHLLLQIARKVTALADPEVP
jgi:DNA-binding MarR family transcriptional regulator